MDKKSRKLLSRLGVAFMLGLSIFNFGAVWNKMRGGEMPRKVRNIRNRTQEEISSDVKEIASIAQEEAEVVLASQILQQEESQLQLQSETLTISQKAVRYSAISVWVVSAGLIFSSAVFNYPFALGKGLLSLLPGVPHVASLDLESQGNFFKVQEEIPIKIIADSNQEPIKAVSLLLEFDPNQLSFQRYEVSGGGLDVGKDFLLDREKGTIFLTLESSVSEVVIEKGKLATFFFMGRERSACEVRIDQEKSLVLKKMKDGEFANILGKVSSAKFRLTSPDNADAFCSRSQSFEVDKIEHWESLAKGEILPSGNSDWNTINSEWSFVCSHQNSGEVFLLFSGPKVQLKSIQIGLPGANDDVELSVSKKWQENERYFFATVIENLEMGNDVLESVDLKIILLEKQLMWPENGKANFVLQ